jgi:hypothetical protein
MGGNVARARTLLADDHKEIRDRKSADGGFQTFLTGFAQLDFRGYQSGNHPRTHSWFAVPV